MAKVIATYDFDQDALGLGAFINTTIESSHMEPDEFVIYVHDQDGNPATKAYFERDKLTDGSTVVNLYIEFDRS